MSEKRNDGGANSAILSLPPCPSSPFIVLRGAFFGGFPPLPAESPNFQNLQQQKKKEAHPLFPPPLIVLLKCLLFSAVVVFAFLPLVFLGLASPRPHSSETTSSSSSFCLDLLVTTSYYPQKPKISNFPKIIADLGKGKGVFSLALVYYYAWLSGGSSRGFVEIPSAGDDEEEEGPKGEGEGLFVCL
jgi:hypothetical protein